MTNKSAVTVPNALRAELGCQPGMAELENTKYKSVSFKGDKAKATITIADVVKGVVVGLTAVGTGLTAVTLAVTGFTVVTKLAVPAVKNLTSAMSANPVFALTSGVIALVSAVSAFPEVMESNSSVEDYIGTMGQCRTGSRSCRRGRS